MVTLAAVGAGCLLLAAEQPREKIRLTTTEHLEFPANGVLRLANSIGRVTAQGWDQANVQMTTIKSTWDEYEPREREKVSRELEQVRITSERHGDELLFQTSFPRHHGLHASALLRPMSFNLEYLIKVPRNGEGAWIRELSRRFLRIVKAARAQRLGR